MATTVQISGTLTDFGLDALAALHPRLIFTADRPAVSEGSVLATRRIEVTPAADGSFTVDLVPSVQTSPTTTYTLRIEWLRTVDVWDGLDVLKQMVVPLANAVIGDLASVPATSLWAGATPPLNPQPGLWWLDTSGSPYRLKEWV